MLLMTRPVITTYIFTGSNAMQQVFVDTWAWYALSDRKDTDHGVAQAANVKLLDKGYSFVTTNFY